MHDKYAYEASQMALHDSEKQYLMAFGAAGLSVAADSLSAIKFAEVMPIRNENHVAIDFKIKGDFPKFGNDENDVDLLAVDIVCELSDELNKHHLYKHAQATLSILTITSNVVYGKKTGATPDGRPAKAPFAPGANPMHGRDVDGPSASLNSVSKIPYKNVCEDGISNTFSIVPSTLGTNKTTQINNLVAILDSYFYSQGHHLNVNVMDRQTLIDAMENPNKYPFLTIRISGYAVLFNSLTNEQKVEIINRTYHE
jgi:formate C-acetyltransferase